MCFGFEIFQFEADDRAAAANADAYRSDGSEFGLNLASSELRGGKVFFGKLLVRSPARKFWIVYFESRY